MENLVGKRILIAEKKNSYGPATISEFKILEISPSGSFVKVMDDNGKRYWKNKVDITPIEVLNTKESHPEAKK